LKKPFSMFFSFTCDYLDAKKFFICLYLKANWWFFFWCSV